jgi:hypothetical protein
MSAPSENWFNFFQVKLRLLYPKYLEHKIHSEYVGFFQEKLLMLSIIIIQNIK